MGWDLSGRVAVITGATGVLGEALATELVARGVKVALFGRQQGPLETLAAQLGGPDVARAWVADVTDLAALETAFAGADKHFGRIDIVVANAGIDRFGPLEGVRADDWEAVIDVNLVGVFRTFRAGLPYVRRQRGYLAAISSMAAFVPNPMMTSYAASKFGTLGLCDSLRYEVRSAGVGVGSYHPTFFDSKLLATQAQERAANILWDHHAPPLWAKVSVEEVVANIANGIAARKEFVTAPARHAWVARAMGLFMPLLNYFWYRDNVENAISEWYDVAGQTPPPISH